MSSADPTVSNDENVSPANRALSWNTFLSTYLPALVLALGTGIALPAVPALAKSFNVDFSVASGVVTAFLLGNLFGTIPSGWLIDRFGRRPLMIAGASLTSVMAFLAAFAFSFPELLVLRFLDGIAAQMWLMARLAAISHGAPPGQRGRQVSWMFGMNNTGALAGPVLGGFIASEWGRNAPFIAYGILALAALVPAFLYVESRGRAAPSPPRDRQAPRLTVRQIVGPRLPYFGVALFAGLTRGPIMADLLHLYAAFTYHLEPKQVGYLATGAALISWPIGFAAGWMMDRYGRKRTMVPGFTGVALAMAALGLSTIMGLGFGSYVALFFLAVTLQALTGGSIQTVGADVAPPEARGRFLGLWRFTGQSGMTLSPIIFVLISEYLGYSTSFFFTALSAAAVAALLIRYVPETR
ncbi:MFS transporter [Rhizobium binxianense]